MSADPEGLPRASPAAWSPDATPAPKPLLLSLDDLELTDEAPPADADAAEAPAPAAEDEAAAPPEDEAAPPPEDGVPFVAGTEPADEAQPGSEPPDADPRPQDFQGQGYALPEPEPYAGPYGQGEPESYSYVQPGPAPDAQPEPHAPEPEPDGYAQPEPEPHAQPEPETYAQPEPEPYAQPEPEPYAQPEPEPYAQPEPEPYAQPEPEPYAYAQPEPEPYTHAPPVEEERLDRLAALRDVARRLRTAPDAEATLQYVIEVSCKCTGSEAGMLTLTVPENRQVVWGRALGAGPYISVQLRAGGPSFGELVLTRMADAPEFRSGDETFAELVAEYLAKAAAGLRRGTVLSDEQQDFIDRVTEEIRAPLASAVNLIDTVVGGDASPEESRTYLETAARDSRRLLRLIDDLLHIARMRPPEPRELEAVPVGPWLRRAVEAARPQAEAAGHELVLAEPTAAYVVRGVPPLLDLVLHHLLDNAIKFSEEPGTIDVSAVAVEGLLRICVSDHGIGFDNADASRMLDCFARAINAEAARIPGTGVGLFLAAEVVRGHGGRLWLESRRDEGTQAYAALPFEG